MLGVNNLFMWKAGAPGIQSPMNPPTHCALTPTLMGHPQGRCHVDFSEVQKKELCYFFPHVTVFLTNFPVLLNFLCSAKDVLLTMPALSKSLL